MSSGLQCQTKQLDRFEFRTEAPSWVDLSSEAVEHVGVVEQTNDRQFYKALIKLEKGYERFWAWDDKNGRLPYGPDLPPAIVRMLIAAADE